MFTDFAIADPEDAESVLLGEDDRWPRKSLDGIAELELIALNEILSTGETHSGLLLEAEDSGAALLQMTPSFQNALADLKSTRLEEVGKRWAQEDGLQGFDPADVISMLMELARFAREANKQAKPILYVTAI